FYKAFSLYLCAISASRWLKFRSNDSHHRDTEIAQRTIEIAPGDANLIHRPNGSLLVRARFREKRRPRARKSSRDDALPKACAHKLDLEPEPQRDFRAPTLRPRTSAERTQVRFSIARIA